VGAPGAARPGLGLDVQQHHPLDLGHQLRQRLVEPAAQ
jgi:hypothetical protein